MKHTKDMKHQTHLTATPTHAEKPFLNNTVYHKGVDQAQHLSKKQEDVGQSLQHEDGRVGLSMNSL